PAIHHKKDAAKVASKILGALRSPYRLATIKATSPVTIGVSIGISIIPADGKDVETVTKNADLAMYTAKETGKNRSVFYSRDMDKKAFEKWEIEQGIKKGIQNREFRLCYQPLVNMQEKIIGFEALIRWNHPELGDLPPGRFIPIAEETGLITPLGNWIMEQACRDTAKLNKSGYSSLFVAINLSSKQFEQKDIVDNISSIIQRTRIKPGNLKLEITETCIMNAPEEAIKKMHDIKARQPGIQIAIDDFGTGYSSLSYLSKLPADLIKIDLSFVSKLFQSNNEKIVNAIINLALSLGMEIVAEGVESHDQFVFFKQKKCGLLQGFYFHKPLDYIDLCGILEKGVYV
ncbi:MAG: GGDEF domain-containing protein, partial [Spirochaetales bacterium]